MNHRIFIIFALLFTSLGRWGLAQPVDVRPGTQEIGRARSAASGSRAARDVLFFKNGDLLHGSLASITPADGLRWDRSDALNPFLFDTALISEVQLGSAGTAAGWTNTCTVQLNNGDQLQGRLLSYDGQNVALDTWYAGQLMLPRQAISLILPQNATKAVVFEGPTGLDGWTMGRVNAAAIVDSGQWQYQNGAFYAVKSASIARDIHLPDVASFQFDLDWRGFFHVAIALYTEYLHPVNLANKETEPKFGGFYSMQINPFSANLLPVKQSEPLRYLGQAPLQNLAQKTSAHFDLRINKHKRTIALLVDGLLVKQWVDADSTFAGTGTAIRFVHQGQGIVKLSNIKVTEWDGQFEEPASLTPNKSQDLARLRNGDRIAGPIKAIQADRLTIEAAGTSLDIPLIRVKQVELASGNPPLTQRTPRTVRAHFVSKGALTFDLEQWTSDGLIAKSPSFGTVTFKSDAFSRIVFDLSASRD